MNLKTIIAVVVIAIAVIAILSIFGPQISYMTQTLLNAADTICSIDEVLFNQLYNVIDDDDQWTQQTLLLLKSGQATTAETEKLTDILQKNYGQSVKSIGCVIIKS